MHSVQPNNEIIIIIIIELIVHAWSEGVEPEAQAAATRWTEDIHVWYLMTRLKFKLSL